ncbi:AAA family ATPase [Desulfurivibrio sp. D14AmB]|uniref:AAA family ATPase n=1 Tax=Desulfurivibrio sp. D14AmB TaxID=3374370 RepID=UPI00376F4281
MKVKRFEAPNTKSALALVKEELGSEAVILSTRTVRPASGAAGYGRTASWVEVVAAVDFDLEETITAGQAVAPPARPALRKPCQPAPRAQAAPPPDDSPAAGVNLSREARLLQQRFGTWRGERQEADPLSVSPTPRRPAASGPASPAPPSPQGKNGRPRPEEVASWRDQILEQLNVRPLDLDQRGAGPLVIALVGPTGVGKTTTAAKIAAWFSLHENASVTLLSMDCYRIGATEQLRTYARIMQLPCEVALREQDLAKALHKHRHKDLIIIDTAGKSPFDEGHIPELHRWFSPHAEIMPYLVLSATAKKEDINHIIAAYRPLGVPAAILTKLDETRAYAALCQQMARAELPIACLCTGQKVPEDFLPASKDFLKTLFGRGWDAAMTSQQSVNQAAGWLQ